MISFLNIFYKKFNIISNRSKNITKHVFISFFYKGASILANILLVPLTINLLDTENYGIWLTITSFISWFSFFDIGLGHGLRNKFAEAKANGDVTLTKEYVSTAYIILASICLLLLILFLLINNYIDWTKLFNTNISKRQEFKILMPFVFSFFIIQIVLKLITSIYTADQNHSIQVKLTFLISISSLFTIWILTIFKYNSLLFFSLIYSVLPLFILIFLNIYAFFYKFKEVRPSYKFFRIKLLKDIFYLGLSFFLIQMSLIILFSTDNIIIIKLYGPEQVVPLNIAHKYMSISAIFFSTITSPYWSATTEAYIKGDINWIKNSIKKLTFFSFITIIILILMLLISPMIFKIWIGENVVISFTLTFYISIFFIISILYSPFNYILNGIGKIQIQVYYFLIASLVNIPLSIFLAKNLGFGVNGIILSSIICILPLLIILPIQYYKIIYKKANGIWNK